MLQQALLCQTNPFITLDTFAAGEADVRDANVMPMFDVGEFAAALAMQREIEEMAQALDEIAQCVIY